MTEYTDFTHRPEYFELDHFHVKTGQNRKVTSPAKHLPLK